MPRKPKKPCHHPGCPELTDNTYCKNHEKEMSQEYDRTQRPHKHLYKTSRWLKLRKQILTNQPLCLKCQHHGRITPATVADHIKPHQGEEAWFYDMENLQPLCKSCHDRKTAKEDGRWGMKNRAYTY